jgi:hypothetical protein
LLRARTAAQANQENSQPIDQQQSDGCNMLAFRSPLPDPSFLTERTHEHRRHDYRKPSHSGRHRVPAGIFPESRDEPARFQSAVLWQARNPRTPLLERLRFLCIVSSNLDEFFEIREAGIKEQLKLNSVAITTDGKTAREVYRLVSDEVHAIVKEQYALLNEEILPQLATEGIRFLKRGDWNDAQREWIRDSSSAK